jgi:hypothetical protein
MKVKRSLTLILSAFLITMCRSYSAIEPANPIAGLSCRAFNSIAGSRGVECTYECPDRTVGPLVFENDPSNSATKGDMDRIFCNIDLPTQPVSTTFPTATSSPTSSPSPTLASSATAGVPVTAQDPLLSETASMCDLGGKLINFRLVAPAPDLTGKDLEVKISEQETICYLNPTNSSLLTCSIPNDITFPAHVVVNLDGAIVNDFLYSGFGCTILTTPTPSKIRTYP